MRLKLYSSPLSFLYLFQQSGSVENEEIKRTSGSSFAVVPLVSDQPPTIPLEVRYPELNSPLFHARL